MRTAIKQLLCIAILLCISFWGQTQILNRVKQKAEQRANQKIDQAIDKGLDKTEEAAKTDKKIQIASRTLIQRQQPQKLKFQEKVRPSLKLMQNLILFQAIR